MNPITEQKYINLIRELEKRVEKLEHTKCPYANGCISAYRGSIHVDDMGRYDHYTDTFVKE